MIGRLLCLATATGCAAMAAWLAWHHPLSPTMALLGCAALATATALRFMVWPIWVLALLPLAGLMPWTGWLITEEFDLVILAVAAGGYLRLGLEPLALQDRLATLLRVLAVLAPYTIATAISLQRGAVDAGGWQWGWWQGYAEPLNSLRLAKPLIQVVLLLPLWLAIKRRDRPAADAAVNAGMLGMLFFVGMSVLWERWLFPGLLNFSTDYRATGFFWEMHVGGAPLDAVLAMAMPFVALSLVRERNPLRWIALAALAMLGLYACLVTFSRIVYAAVPISLAVAALLQARVLRSTPGAMVQGPIAVAPPLLSTLLALAAYAALAVTATALAGLRALALAWTLAVATSLAVALLRARKARQAPDWARQGLAAATFLGISAAVAVFMGGYMGQRVHHVADDGNERRTHWARALSLMDGTADWLVGKGMGRYHVHHGLSGLPEDQTGDYRLIQDAQGGHVVLTSGKHAFGSDGVFRLSQRLAIPAELASHPPQSLNLSFSVRSEQTVYLAAEVCEKHLIYYGSCVNGLVAVRPTQGAWVSLNITLQGPTALRANKLPPVLTAFSLGITSAGHRLELDRLQLRASAVGSSNTNLLVNGDFEQGLSRWYSTSDRHHLPWHAKNQLLHILFEQGLAGLLAFGLLVMAAAWRIWRAAGNGEPAAPALGAAAVGMLTVGLVDSLFDMPRATFLGLWVLLMALSLSARDRPRRHGPARRSIHSQGLAAARRAH